ncbi:ABC transporter substrate-binding protein [Geosporobacter ferrireducens]|uniref:ABC transporter substrate-binding protein n=1 Tax=Geosporobacter ferrireducens TaxID=1424294 RepID=A0A1D8GCT1_9FIRM|nr:ABC transporter substrate-binding protein [Geosporobacter ferrireducens]AOT68715.1 ABC transporter substrate-binding protein [Geosporobacter ferrireducens]MTI57603.1 ABC transporter substrate-binding protein [Geosporobacter ferrireducens]
MGLRKRIVSILLTGLFAVSFAGCSANNQQNSVSAEDKGALKGQITIYTSQPEADIQALLESFNKVYPDIQANVFRSGTEEVVSKVLAEKEANAVLADVLLVADAATFEGLKAKELLMSYASPELKGISSDFYDAENTYTGTKIITTGIIVNKEMIKEPVESLADLMKERFKNNIIMPSPLYSGAAAYNLSVITRSQGLGWEFYEALKGNQVTVEKGNGAVQKAVVAGEKGSGMIVDYMAIRAKEEGAPVEFIYPKEGSLIITEPVAIIKGTKKEKLAQTFVDFILSEEGQKATAEIGYTPIKSGVSAPEGFKNADEIRNLTYPLDVLVTNRDADKEKFSKLFE